MDYLASEQCETVKRIVKLRDKKYRELWNEFFAEGLRNVLDTARSPEMAGRVKKIIVRESEADRYLGELGDLSALTVLASAKAFDKLSDTENAQGIVAVFAKPPFCGLPQGDLCVYLDRMRDPGNLGTVIRTACAADVPLILSGCTDVYNPKVVRSAMSAVVKTHLTEGDEKTLDALAADGWKILGADAGGEDVFSNSPTGKICLVVGNEANGIGSEARSRCGGYLSLPCGRVESLNAAVSAGILMYMLKFNR